MDYDIILNRITRLKIDSLERISQTNNIAKELESIEDVSKMYKKLQEYRKKATYNILEKRIDVRTLIEEEIKNIKEGTEEEKYKKLHTLIPNYGDIAIFLNGAYFFLKYHNTYTTRSKTFKLGHIESSFSYSLDLAYDILTINKNQL